MAVMEWNEQLDIGVDQMNHQHQNLLNIMNRLHDSHEKGESFLKQIQTLEELGQATIKHFKEEEEYMASIGFQGLEVHKIIHKDLLDKLAQHVETAEKNQNLDKQLFIFLKAWLTAHIMGIDTKYAAVANAA